VNGTRTKVKICGITSVEDALMAVDAGAEMLGFNFYRKSPRFIGVEAAREIVRNVRDRVECVGVFVNEAQPCDVLAIVQEVGLATAQLHGDESRDYCSEVGRACSVIKALRVGEGFDAASALEFGGRLLLDTASAQFGGSGKVFDWSVAAELRDQVRELILAGGLHAGNVGEAIASVGPHAVDACSGLESTPGTKDRDKVLAFMAAVRVADEQGKAKVRSA
jgi:phosphoribosylanthranilate isomerase